YALAGRDPEPNTTIRKEEATWSRTSSCRCGSEQFIQKENFPEFTYRLFVLWNRVIYTKLLTHPSKKQISLTFPYYNNNLFITSITLSCCFSVIFEPLGKHKPYSNNLSDTLFLSSCG